MLAGGLWRTFADPNQLENALLNLALNARDAMPNGGKVTIETANCYLDEAYVAALAEPVEPGQYVMIAVADTGIGMDASDAWNAPSSRSSPPRRSARAPGLGLSQVYGFVRQSAGHVEIYSEIGEGTTVKIYLPRYHRRRRTRRNRAPPTQDIARAIGAETILVVEDDEALRAYTVEILSELGYAVLRGAGWPQRARDARTQPEIDLLFTDIVMPGGMNGRQLADEAMRRRPGLKVLFTTGYTRNAIIHHGRLDPGVHLIGKPFSFRELGAMVRELLDR